MQSALSVLKGLTRSLHEVAPLATDGTYASVMKPYVAILTAEAYEFHKDYIARTPELYQAPTLKRLRAGADVTMSAYIQSRRQLDRKSTRLNSSHGYISYAVFCLKKKN